MKLKMMLVAFAFVCAVSLYGQDKPAPASPPGAPPDADFLVSNIDFSIAPGTDFFTYANGAWLARNPIPPSEAYWGIGNLVNEELYVKLRGINEKAAAAGADKGTDQQRIGDFWATAMDEAKADAQGLRPVQGQLAMIDSIRTEQDALDVAFALAPLGVHAFCELTVEQDEKASDLMAVHISQGGLGLPERSFYFNPEKGTARIRREYVAHMGRMLRMLGRPEAEADADAAKVMEFETALATASRKLEDLRDPEKNYNKMSADMLTREHSPSIAWEHRLDLMSMHSDYVVVGQPEFFNALDHDLRHTPIATLKDYLRIRLLSKFAPYLNKAWDEEQFSFAGKVMSGQKEQRPRWKRVLDVEGQAMGMSLGKLFVAAYFPPQAKQRYVALVEAIRTSYGERIDRLTWMSEATRAHAREKLARLTAKVGYPDHWKDYSGLVVGTNSYCENVMNASRWRFSDMISKLGKPVDRTEWTMTPQTYNAYYNPANNEIVLPAAQFAVPGMRDDQLDDAFVYGYSAASTIGHEITHGFDDEGRQFDPQGNLKNWWTKEDAAQFEKRAAVMAAQFDAYEPLPGLHINGKSNLGENLADYGGILLGLDAFKKTDQYKQGRKIAGLTPLQRFFLGYAFGWLHQDREERMRWQLLSDVHSPARWRVNGPLSNIPDFYEAFGVKSGDPMWRAPETHVEVW